MRPIDDDWRGRLTDRRVLLSLGALLSIVILLALVLAVQVIQARSALLRAQDQAQALKTSVEDGDVQAARLELRGLQASTRDARDATDGWLWSIATKIPAFGRNFTAVRTTSHALNGISLEAVPPLVDLAGRANAQVFSPKGGRIDLKAVRKVAPDLEIAQEALARGWQQIQPINAGSLIGPLDGAITDLQTQLGGAHSTVRAAANAARLIPGMLGGSEARTYILAFQNNAEIRSTGGLPGAFAIVTADDGKLTLDRQGAASDFGRFDSLPIKETKDELRLYSILLTRFWGDTTFTPDFPRTAELMRTMVRQDLGLDADGVISVDPIALSYILEATGPIRLADGKELSSENAVQLLLNGVYLTFPEDDLGRDAYFADAARRVFEAVMSGDAESQTLIRGVAKAANENRVLISSSRRSEERVLMSTRIAGALRSEDGPSPHIGIYFNDATETKLEYYLRRETSVRSTRCTDDGTQSLTTTTRLRSVAPKDANELPGSILGPGTGEKPGWFRMVVAFYAPHGGLLTDLAIDGRAQPLNRVKHDGLNVVTVPVLLKPGQSMEIKASMFSGRGQPDDAVFSTTPGIEATPNDVRIPSACDE